MSAAIWKRAATLLLLAITPLSACQASPAHDYTITDQRRPALWRVTDPVGGNSAYLFGTIHMLPEGVDWQTPALVRALAASDRLVKELGPEDGAPAMESILAGAMDEPVPPMKQRLPDDVYQQMLKLAEQQSLDPQALDRIESWAVSLLLARSQDEFLGIETRLGVDAVLKATKVDGVYTADPNLDPSATRIANATFREVLDQDLKVMDRTAFTLCMENNMPIMVFDMFVDGNLERAVLGEDIGTWIRAE